MAPVTRSRTHSVDSSRAGALSSRTTMEVSAADNLANVLSDMDDRATIHAREARTLRDATVLAIAEVRRDSVAETTRLTHMINEGNTNLLTDLNTSFAAVGEHIDSLPIVASGCPDAVTITPFVCSFSLDDLSQYEIVAARARKNVSSAMRFSEPPASLHAREQLADIVRCFLPMHPEEGILPLMVSKISRAERDWLQDRLGSFNNFFRDPVGSKQRLAKICNTACSALAAVNAAGDDRRTHWVPGTVVTPLWYPLRLKLSLTEMASEVGWAPGRHVVLWIPRSDGHLWTKVTSVTAVSQEKLLIIVIEAFRWSHNSLTSLIRRFGRNSEDGRVIDLCVRLSKSTIAANPIYDVVSRTRIFEGLVRSSIGDQIVNTLPPQPPTILGGPPVEEAIRRDNYTIRYILQLISTTLLKTEQVKVTS
ncbi:hypothetical protein COOONC_02149 [Cooperia oncophora]